MEEKIQLWFQPGNWREGFRWLSVYQGKMVGLCRQSFCEICNLAERESLRNFRGGRVEVSLTLHRRPSFWETREFYLGHLLRIMPGEAAVSDEGFEFDIVKLNTVVCSTPTGAIIIDPGARGFENYAFPLHQLTRRQRIAATIVTHGHLDHWSHLGETGGPVFMSELSYRLASRHAALEKDNKLVRALRRATLVASGEPILLDDWPVKIETFPLSHSIPETMGLVIKGKGARLVHLGDFKFNGMEPKQKAETIATLSRIAREPVDYLSLTIFNAHREGFVPLETSVIDGLIDVMGQAEGRVIISCFSTNLDRIATIAKMAQILGRPVGFVGAGMDNARELLGIKAEGDVVEQEKAVVFVTGCQAEELSVLWRIAREQNPPFALRDSDVVVFSSRAIPGNEEIVRQILAQLRPKVERLIVNEGEIRHLGLESLGLGEALTHVSGHEAGGGIRLAMEILKPKQVLAWPQTSPQIEAFRKIADDLGIEILPEGERVIEI